MPPLINYPNHMTIILDVTRVVRRRAKKQTLTGIDRVTMAYVQHYAPNAYALIRWCGRSWILTPQSSQPLFQWLITPQSKKRLFRILISGIIKSYAIHMTHPTFLLNTGHISLGNSDYPRLTRRHGIKPIFFVHDLIPMQYPEYCSPGEDLRHQKKIHHVLTLGHGIITNSQTTEDELRHYAKQMSTPIPPTTVALLGAGWTRTPAGNAPINKPYFVILSTIEPRKNHLLLLQIWRKLVQKKGPSTPHLFIIGQRGWDCENAIDLLERCPLLQETVTEVPHCSDAMLVSYLHYSQSLLFPSFVEGYGLPLMEALSLRVPVIASDLPVFREIAGEVPEYLDPLDGKQWEAVITEYSTPKSSQRAAQLERLSHWQAPTWGEHFMKVKALLTQIS